ncbi:MAG: hypothetical protein ABI809_04380 [Caldimonas sp.]
MRDLSRLDAGERARFDDLRWRRLGDRQVRLEQERIGLPSARAGAGGSADGAVRCGLKADRTPGTRELVVTKTRYLIPYRVRGNVVEVLRIFHTSRRTPKRW